MKQFKKRISQIIACFLIVAWIIPVISVSATANIDQNWRDKISDELWSAMEEAGEEDLLTVYLWLNQIDQDEIDQAVREEKGMDPAIYEDETRFQTEIVSKLEEKLVSRVGYEAAHAKEEASTTAFSLNENGAYHDTSMSLVDRAVQGESNRYLQAKRDVTIREYSERNGTFVEENVADPQKVLYQSTCVSMVVVKATKDEICDYAKSPSIHDISLYHKMEIQPSMDTVFDQVNAGYNGTKGTSFNNGNGYKGTGIKIGIIETGFHDAEHPLLLDQSLAGRLYRVRYPLDLSFNPQVTDHATQVAAMLVGYGEDGEETIHEGIVPLATAYLTTISGDITLYPDEDDFVLHYRPFEELTLRGVSVINCSFGVFPGSLGERHYMELDRYVDEFILSTGITVVVSAGNYQSATNPYNEVLTPGKAFGAITVGNAETISSSHSSISAPYGMHFSSSYVADDSLPNKPDISAPGTNVSILKKDGENFYSVTGTSFAAPIVTGVVAQLQQKGPLIFRTEPGLVKNVLILGADKTKIRTNTTTPSDSANTQVATPSYNSYLWQKSGAGLVDAVETLNHSSSSNWGTSTFYETGTEAITAGRYFESGTELRVVLTWKASHCELLEEGDASGDNLLLHLENASGAMVASSIYGINNVRIIEYTIQDSGYYSFGIYCDGMVGDSIDYYYSWRTY